MPLTGDGADPTRETRARDAPDPGVTITRVLVVDDHRGFAALLGAALDGEPDLHCVGLAHDGDEALTRVAELEPDIVLVDVAMPGRDGIEVTRTLRRTRPDVVVVMMTAHRNPVWALRAADAGAAALVAKDGSLDNLLEAVRHARRSV